MLISVRVNPNSKKELVEKTGEREYIVRVKAAPVEGKANEAVIKLLSEHCDIPKSRISILKGHSGKTKLIEIC